MSTANYIPQTSYQEDRDEDKYSEAESTPAFSKQTSGMSQYSEINTSPSIKQRVSQEEMINITACSFADFQAYMSGQYGATQFNEGFKIVRHNQDLIYLDDGEEQMIKFLGHLLPERDECRGFINFCTTYLIVQNMQFQ